jgi:hypothetical protein
LSAARCTTQPTVRGVALVSDRLCIEIALVSRAAATARASAGRRAASTRRSTTAAAAEPLRVRA